MLLTATFYRVFAVFSRLPQWPPSHCSGLFAPPEGYFFPHADGRDFHRRTGKRQTRAVELNPSDPKGNTHRSRSPFLCGDNRIPTRVEKEAEVILCQLAKAPRAGAFVFGFAGGEGSTRGGMHRTGFIPRQLWGPLVSFVRACPGSF